MERRALTFVQIRHQRGHNAPRPTIRGSDRRIPDAFDLLIDLANAQAPSLVVGVRLVGPGKASYHAAEHLDIAFKQCQPVLAGLLADPSGNDHHGRILRTGKVAGGDADRGGNRHLIGNVLGLCTGPRRIGIPRHDLCADTHQRHGVARSAAHHAGSGNSDFNPEPAPKIDPRTSPAPDNPLAGLQAC